MQEKGAGKVCTASLSTEVSQRFTQTRVKILVERCMSSGYPQKLGLRKILVGIILVQTLAVNFTFSFDWRVVLQISYLCLVSSAYSFPKCPPSLHPLYPDKLFYAQFTNWVRPKLILMFEWQICRQQGEGPEFLDPGFLITWILSCVNWIPADSHKCSTHIQGQLLFARPPAISCAFHAEVDAPSSHGRFSRVKSRKFRARPSNPRPVSTSQRPLETRTLEPSGLELRKAD